MCVVNIIGTRSKKGVSSWVKLCLFSFLGVATCDGSKQWHITRQWILAVLSQLLIEPTT